MVHQCFNVRESLCTIGAKEIKALHGCTLPAIDFLAMLAQERIVDASVLSAIASNPQGHWITIPRV